MGAMKNINKGKSCRRRRQRGWRTCLELFAGSCGLGRALHVRGSQDECLDHLPPVADIVVDTNFFHIQVDLADPTLVQQFGE